MMSAVHTCKKMNSQHLLQLSVVLASVVSIHYKNHKCFVGRKLPSTKRKKKENELTTHELKGLT